MLANNNYYCQVSSYIIVHIYIYTYFYYIMETQIAKH